MVIYLLISLAIPSKMFNSGEMDIFSRLNCSPIFYGETIAGANMPNLMYMTTHENMEVRNEHWKQFGADPAWAAMKDLPEYQHTGAKNATRLLYTTEYSDLYECKKPTFVGFLFFSLSLSTPPRKAYMEMIFYSSFFSLTATSYS